MFVLKIELLAVMVLVLFNLEVDSAYSSTLKEANNITVDSENPESAELEYRMLHNKKSRKVLAKLLQKFLEKFDHDSDESNEKQTVFDISKASTIASILTTEVMNTKANNIIDSTTPIPIATEQSTEVSNSTFEVTNSDQSHVTEPINTTLVSDPDDVINPIQNNDDNNYPAKTSVTDKNIEKNNNSSTKFISSEIPVTTPTESTMLSNDFTTENDNVSTTQSPITTQTSGLIDSANPENVLDRPKLEKLDNISTTKGPDNSLTEKPEILNFTEGIKANNESSDINQEFKESGTTQNIGLTNTILENVTTSSPLPIFQENTNELKNVMPKIYNLTENNVISNDTVFPLRDSDKPSTSQREISADTTNSKEPLNTATTKTSEIPKKTIEFNDTNTSEIPDNNTTQVINSNNANTNGIRFSTQMSQDPDPLQKEPKIATTTVPIIVTTITSDNPNNLRDIRTTMMPVGNSTEDINSTSDELATSQPTGLTESPIHINLENNNINTTKTSNSTETTKNIESVTTKLPLTGFTNSPIFESPDNKSSLATEEQVIANNINNSNSEHANDTTKISIAENPKDYNTSVPPKDTNLNSSIAVELNNSSIPNLTDSTSEPPTNADNKPDKLKPENNVNETKSQEHIVQQNSKKETICDSTSRPNGTTDINNSNSSTEESNLLKNNTLLIILLQNPISKSVIPKNSLQRLFMLMMTSNS